MKNKFTWALVAVILLSVAGFAMPARFFTTVANPQLGDRIGLAITLSILGAGFVGVWFFLTSLKSFTTNLRRVYYLLSAGIVIWSLFQVQLLLQVLFLNVTAFSSALLLLPWLLGSLFLYLGLRKLARLLEVKSIWRSFWVTAGCALTVAIIVALLTHAFLPIAPENADLLVQAMIILGLAGWSGMFGVSAGILGLRTRHLIGVAYRTPMLWLALGQFSLAVGACQEIGKNFATALIPAWYEGYGISLIFFFITGLCMMRAAYLFKEVGQPTDALPATATPLDNVMYAASLVSNPRAVEQPLNKIRQMTAAAQNSSNTLKNSDIVNLKSVYLELEDYLIHREPLRQLDQAYIRSHLNESFRQQLGQA